MCLQQGRPGFDPWVGKIPWRREMAMLVLPRSFLVLSKSFSTFFFFFQFLNSSSFKGWSVHRFASFRSTGLRFLCECPPHTGSLRCPPYIQGVALFHLYFSSGFRLDFISVVRIQHRASMFLYFSFPFFPPQRKKFFNWSIVDFQRFL